jgi:hypothetical protein
VWALSVIDVVGRIPFVISREDIGSARSQQSENDG